MTAAATGPIRPLVHRFGWAGGEVTTILDGATVRDAVRPPFSLAMDDATMAEVGRANRIPSDRMEHGFVPTLIRTGGKLVLFDTGFGARGPEPGLGMLVERMAAAGYRPEDVDVLAFTHLHPDHFLGITTGDSLTFPNAQLVVGRHEFDTWRSGEGIPEVRAQNRALFQKMIEPLAERFTFVEDGDSIAPGITAEAAFGHSLGHMMYRYEGAGQQLLVWGDVTNHYVWSLQHPRQPVFFDDDRDLAVATRLRVLDMVAQDGLLVAGFHMPFPSVGYVERRGDSFGWVAATYQPWLSAQG
jgi:glyoxylase-like metal-dependent hydrolase (beta-lactamase superfamily II)